MIKSQTLLSNTGLVLGMAISLIAGAGSTLAADHENPFLGDWALTIPGGGAGWLGVTDEGEYYDASILWGTGSVLPVASVFFSDDSNMLFITRLNEVKRKDASGKVVRTHLFAERLIVKVSGDDLTATREVGRENGRGIIREEFTGQRIPPMPSAPDLSKAKFGSPIKLFNGKNLDGWKLTDSSQVNGWSAQDGLLSNRPTQQEGKHIPYGNLRTEQEFEDFNLTLEFRLTPGGNSGVYLRGIYEVQVADTYGKKLDPHNCGAIYSRITPSSSAEKPAGEWQTYDITLLERHATVVLNGVKIIDNAPLRGCTGGALWSDPVRPGPIYLQGDHTGIDYRNIVLKPVVK